MLLYQLSWIQFTDRQVNKKTVYVSVSLNCFSQVYCISFLIFNLNNKKWHHEKKKLIEFHCFLKCNPSELQTVKKYLVIEVEIVCMILRKAYPWIVCLLILRESKSKREIPWERGLKINPRVNSTRPCQMIAISCKHILDLAHLQRTEILWNKHLMK